MTLTPEPPEPDALLDKAIAWIVLLKTGEPTREEFDTFKQWRSQSPEHEAAFRRAALINQRAGIVAGRLTTPDNVSHLADVAARRGGLSRRALLAAASRRRQRQRGTQSYSRPSGFGRRGKSLQLTIAPERASSAEWTCPRRFRLTSIPKPALR
ncbi:MAG: FecR/PupR family sigma factor regulator [Xanthobacteraceae bacterium]